MKSNSFMKYYKCAEIIKIPKQGCKIIRGYEMRRGRVCRKEMLFVKYNNYMGFVKLENGEFMSLTEPQLHVIERLIKAAEDNEIYVHSRDLIDCARSKSWHFATIFQHRKNRPQFIEATPMGFYRLKLYADPHKLKYETALRKIKKRKATGELLNRRGERFY
jgi:hypothetical protein